MRGKSESAISLDFFSLICDTFLTFPPIGKGAFPAITSYKTHGTSGFVRKNFETFRDLPKLGEFGRFERKIFLKKRGEISHILEITTIIKPSSFTGRGLPNLSLQGPNRRNQPEDLNGRTDQYKECFHKTSFYFMSQ